MTFPSVQDIHFVRMNRKANNQLTCSNFVSKREIVMVKHTYLRVNKMSPKIVKTPIVLEAAAATAAEDATVVEENQQRQQGDDRE
jgi:hypothetical protein